MSGARRRAKYSVTDSRTSSAIERSSIRAYKLRLYPTRTRECALAQWFGHDRWVWNWALAARRKAYARRGERLTSVELSRILTRIKRAKPWLAEIPSSCLGQKLRDLDAAYRNAFDGRARLPVFKSRRSAQRVRVRFDQRHAGKVRAWLEGRMVLPGLGAVKLRGRRLPKAMPKLVTVSRDAAGHYWVSFAVEATLATPAPPRRRSVGIDLGVSHLATLSTGALVENPRPLTRHLGKHLQQRLARQCRGAKRARHARGPGQVRAQRGGGRAVVPLEQAVLDMRDAKRRAATRRATLALPELRGRA